MTPLRVFALGEVVLSKDDPLSVDLTMFPVVAPPTATKVLFPEMSAGFQERSSCKTTTEAIKL